MSSAAAIGSSSSYAQSPAIRAKEISLTSARSTVVLGRVVYRHDQRKISSAPLALCGEAGLPQCRAHGLRKLAATRLANGGCSERENMTITGHRSLSEVSRYTKAAEQVRLAEQAMSKRAQGMNSEQKLSNPATWLDKTSSK